LSYIEQLQLKMTLVNVSKRSAAINHYISNLNISLDFICTKIIQRSHHHPCNLDVWALVQCRGVGHRSLVTPERVLNEYNIDIILIFYNIGL